MFRTTLTAVVCFFGTAQAFPSSRDIRDLARNRVQGGSDPDTSQLNFYGKITTPCDVDDCFSAVVATGRTNFQGDGGDLANIYVPANDYDTWKQHMPLGRSSDTTPIEGEFTYQLKNESLSCLTVELRWMFAPSLSAPEDPLFRCVGTPIAMNWDCHLDWALITQCSFNATINQIEAVYTVQNLGPEEVEGEGQVIVVNQDGNEGSFAVSSVFRSTRK